jgi:hypothetical protein
LHIICYLCSNSNIHFYLYFYILKITCGRHKMFNCSIIIEF